MGKAQRVRQARQKLEQVRAQQRSADRRRKVIAWIAAAVAAAAVASVVVVVAVSTGSHPGISGVVSFSGLRRGHVNGEVVYPQTPPAGGKHSPVWLNCGVYATAVSNENAVHSLEHGAVWITYRPGLSAAGLARVRALAAGQNHLIVSPYPGLPAAVAASAWGKQLRVQSASDPRLKQFVSTYEQGPQTPEPGAACTGGTGTPLSP